MKTDFATIASTMAKILEDKNDAYGNSFDSTMQKWGTNVAGARLDDKINRIDGMLKDNDFSKNGESLLDNLFDLAGYSFLLIRYLINNNLISSEDVKKYFTESE